MALFLITTVKMMRKIFSLFSKIKIRVISEQPQDLNIYEWQSQIGLCIIISEPKKTLKYSLFFVENHQTRSLQIKKKISWFCDGKNYGKLQMVKFSHRRLSQGRWIVFREKNYEKKFVEISPLHGLPLHLYIALVCCASPSLSSTYGTFPFIGTTLRMVGLPFLEKAVNG